MTRDEMIARVRKRAKGAQRTRRHTLIECKCSDLRHREDTFEPGNFCPSCARKEAVRRGLARNDVQPEKDGPDDRIVRCDRCDAILSTELDEIGSLEELEHWEDRGRTLESSRLNSPDRWREFLFCVEGVADEYLPRVEAIIREHCGT